MYGLTSTSLAIRTAPVLSSDGSSLYLAGNANRLYCFQAEQGNLIWLVETSGANDAEPVPHEVEGSAPVVYFIEVSFDLTRNSSDQKPMMEERHRADTVFSNYREIKALFVNTALPKVRGTGLSIVQALLEMNRVKMR